MTDAGSDAGPPLNPSDPIAIAAGLNHACALRLDHKVYCWGNNADGELGPNGAGTQSAAPVEVPFQSGVNPVAIFAGENMTCVVDDAGGVWCWGSNAMDALGNNSLDAGSFKTPGRVQTASGNLVASTVGGAAGQTNNPGACVIAADKSLSCWGSSPFNAYGFGTSSSPVAVTANPSAGNTPVASVSCGGQHSAAVVTHGGKPAVATWGLNSFYQLGSFDAGAAALNPAYPTLPANGVPALVGAGGTNTCAVDTNGAISCWGKNDKRQLGPDTAVASTATPQTNSDFQSDKVSALAVGTGTTCVIIATGDVYCFGDNSAGQLSQLGAGSTSATRVQVMEIAHDAVAISAGTNFFCALRQGLVAGGRSVWCWGTNYDQQLGVADAGKTCGALPCSPTPVKVALPN